MNNKDKKTRANNLFFNKLKVVVLLILLFSVYLNLAQAQSGIITTTGDSGSGVTNSTGQSSSGNSVTNISPKDVDISSPTFRLLICDGPPLPDSYPDKPANYIPCDFKGLMMQFQHFINIALVLGVVSAILLITWSGGLYVSGQPKNIDKARNIFPVVIKGFIIMLLAWFIVYQILEWLTGSKSFGVLLGS